MHARHPGLGHGLRAVLLSRGGDLAWWQCQGPPSAQSPGPAEPGTICVARSATRVRFRIVPRLGVPPRTRAMSTSSGTGSASVDGSLPIDFLRDEPVATGRGHSRCGRNTPRRRSRCSMRRPVPVDQRHARLRPLRGGVPVGSAGADRPRDRDGSVGQPGRGVGPSRDRPRLPDGSAVHADQRATVTAVASWSPGRASDR